MFFPFREHDKLMEGLCEKLGRLWGVVWEEVAVGSRGRFLRFYGFVGLVVLAAPTVVSAFSQLCLHVLGVVGCWGNTNHHHHDADHGPLPCLTARSQLPWMAQSHVLRYRRRERNLSWPLQQFQEVLSRRFVLRTSKGASLLHCHLLVSYQQ